MKKDNCRIKNADMCMRCYLAWETPKGNGIRWAICKKCAKELKKLLKHYSKHGLYLTHLEKT